MSNLPAESNDSSIADTILETVAREQAYQDVNDRLKAVQEQLDAERIEKEKFRTEREELATTNEQLREANNSTQATFATISLSVKDYETRIRILEREKEEIRQDFSQLKQKSRTDDDLVRKYRENSESDGRQIRQLDIERSEAIYAKNKMEHQHKILSSALDTARKETELYSKALMEKDSEFSTYRSSHYLELQQTLSERDRESQSRSQVENARSQLERQYQSNLSLLNTTQSELNSLQQKLHRKESDFRSDASVLQKRIEQLESRSREDREAVEGVEEAFREAQEEHLGRIREYEEEVEEAKEKQEEAERKMEEMHKMVELLSGVNGSSSTGGFGITPTTELAASVNGFRSSSMYGAAQGKSLRQAVAETVRLQAELNNVNAENDRLQGLCRTVLRELEERKPVLDQQRIEWQNMKDTVDEQSTKLAVLIRENDTSSRDLTATKTKLTTASTENETLKSEMADLTLQVRILTREIAIRDDPALAYEPFNAVGERQEISDIDSVITDNLTAFKNLPGLLDQNKKLLRVSRELGKKLEEKTKALLGGDASENDLENAAKAIEELTGTVSVLQDQLEGERSQLQLAIKERDMFSRLLVQGRLLGMSSQDVNRLATGTTELTADQYRDDVVRNVLSGIQAEFERQKQGLQKDIQVVQEQLSETQKHLRDERERVASVLSGMEAERNRNLALNQKIEQNSSDIATHLNTIATREFEIQNLRAELRRLTEEQNQVQQQKAQLQSLLDGANAQKEVLQANEKASSEETSKLFQEKAELARELSSRRMVHDQELSVAQHAQAEAVTTAESIRADLEVARNALSEQRQANQALLTSSRSPELQKRIDELEGTLKTLEATREETVGKLKQDLVAAQEDAQNKLRIGLRYQGRSKDLSNELKEAKDQHTQALSESQSQVDTLKTQINTLNQQYVTAATELQDVKTSLAEKTKQAEDARQEVEAVRKEVETVRKEVDMLKQTLAQKDINHALTLAAASASANGANQTASAELQQSLNQARSRISILEVQLGSATASLDAALIEQKRLSDALAAATVATQANNDSSAVVSAQKIADGSHNQQMAAMLQSRIQTDMAQTEVRSLKSRVEELVQALATAQTAAQTQTQTQPTQQESTKEDGEITEDDIKAETPQTVDSAGALAELQAEYEKYKTEQTSKYELGVLRVNSANAKLKQDVDQLRAVKSHVSSLQKQHEITPTSNNFVVIPAIDEIIATVHSERDRAKVQAEQAAVEQKKAEEALTATKEELADAKEALAAAKAELVAAESKPQLVGSDDTQLKALRSEVEEAKKEVAELTKQLRSAEEKAAKSAVKASMTDRYKKDLAEMKQKLATASAPSVVPSAGPGISLSIKGESSNAGAGAGISTDDAIDVKPDITASPGVTRGTRGVKSVGVRGTSVRGAARASARGRGGRGGVNQTLENVLAAVQDQFTSTNTGQKRRQSESRTDAEDSQDGTKRPKIEQDQTEGKNGGPSA